MDYKLFILNKLLDKYESSKSLIEKSNRRIKLNLKELREYDIENYELKKIFHDIVFDLHEKGLIEFSWKEYENGNILNEIWLVKENVEKCYREINRISIKEINSILIDLLEQEHFEKMWIEDYRKDMIAYLQEKNKPNSLFPHVYAKDIINVLKFVDSGQEILKRVLSIKCFGDSKYFEKNVENYIIRIVKKYCLYGEDLDNYTDEDILLEVGISRYPEIIEFCGDLEYTISDCETIEYKKQTYGSYINSYNIRTMRNLKIKNANKIIFIENKANYIDYVFNKQQKDEFVIYHGGMYSPRKGEFFKKIYESVRDKNVIFMHWSDIDIGGFNIFIRLKNIISDVKPYLMDVESLVSKKMSWKKMDSSYYAKLELMRDDERYSVFRDVIEEMLKNNCKLEQEAFLV